VDSWERADEILERMEHHLLVILLTFMIVTAFLQIILRNFFNTGFAWGDSLVRNLVLWIGFIGATLATKEGKHINIDLISRWMPPRGKIVTDLITQLFSFLVCALLAIAAFKFIRNEALMGQATVFGIPAWVPELILPGTFAVMTFRFGLRFLKNLFLIDRMDSNPEGEKKR
jgi:TRAP-type C4-dicarboxylate transport system permease small subunit